MLVKKIDTASELREEFRNYDRDQYNCGTYEALIEYYDGLEDTELDVIAICCDLTEVRYSDVYNNYDSCRDAVLEALEIDESKEDSINFEDEKVKNAIVEFLSENTSVLCIGHNFISFWRF